ncbi:MAG: autotransporter-associated beta strand repeat-containing protein [Armatimonadetes bacterium]|nr:autotransporter-associated beta strand repeat-containing protein [Armatimonadota bacterium]
MTLNQSGNSEFRGTVSTVSGAGALTKNGAGDLALYNANTYSGGTVLNAGRLLLANNAALGTGTITINGEHIRAHEAERTLSNPLALNGSFVLGQLTNFTGNATLVNNITITSFDATTNASVLSGVISGNGFGITKSGAGVLTLSGNSTYTGTTTVSAGRLNITSGSNATSGYSVAQGATPDMGGFGIPGGKSLSVNGTLQNMGTGAFTVASGATLSGTGAVPVSVSNTSGIVSPGNSAGTLTINGNYAQSGTGVLNIEIASLSSFDVLAINGSATLGGTLNISFASGFPNAFPATFDFLTTTGNLTGFFQNVNLVGSLPSGATGYSVRQSANGNGQRLTLVVVPEANAGLLALLAAPLLVGVFRKRK